MEYVWDSVDMITEGFVWVPWYEEGQGAESMTEEMAGTVERAIPSVILDSHLRE